MHTITNQHPQPNRTARIVDELFRQCRRRDTAATNAGIVDHPVDELRNLAILAFVDANWTAAPGRREASS